MAISIRKTQGLPLGVLLALTFLLPGCLERKETTILNPDGSGKSVVDTFLPMPPTPAGSPKIDPMVIAKQVATQLVIRGQGVDAWKDLAVEASPDGRAHVAMTAYFPDISKFRLDAPFVTSWTKDAAGNYTLLVKKDNPGSQPAPPVMTDEQVAAAITAAKADYKQNQPSMQLILSTLKIEKTFILPGAVSATNILTKAADGNAVSLTVEGKSMLAAMDKIMADDKTLGAAVRAGNNSPMADEMLTQNIFGKSGPISATVTGPVKEQFDYKAESAAAKAAQGGMFEKAGINPSAPPLMPGAPSGPVGAPIPGNP